MPRISFFYGIAIFMHWNEGAHARPHFHRARSTWSENGPAFTGLSSKRTGSARDASKRSKRSIRFLRIGSVEQLVDITGVEVVGDHRLRLTFADGTVGDVDFAERAWGGVLASLSDPSYFARVYVDEEAGTIAWPGGIDLAPEPLYDAVRQAVR